MEVGTTRFFVTEGDFMEYTTLGKTGLTISRMGFGGIPIQKVDVPAVRTLMQSLADCGVNYRHGARLYRQ